MNKTWEGVGKARKERAREEAAYFMARQRLPKDIEADVSFQIQVGVVHLVFAMHLWRLVWVVAANLDGELEACLSIDAFVWCDVQVEVHQVVWVWELQLAGWCELQLIVIWQEREGEREREREREKRAGREKRVGGRMCVCVCVTFTKAKPPPPAQLSTHLSAHG